jgi:hypothetical protein
VGEWQVNFHNVGKAEIDGSMFHGSDISVINFYNGTTASCDSAMNMTVYGKWNQQPGYKMILRAGDAGSPGFNDTVRVELFAPSGASVYDTHWGSEFTDKSSCNGSARTGLDAGNVTINMP